MRFESIAQFNAQLRRAMYQERLVRDAGFLGVHSQIGRHEVVPLTLYHYVALKVAGSPFLPPYTQVTPEKLCQFLWLLNPSYRPDNVTGKREFMKECGYFFQPKLPYFLPLRRFIKWKQRSEMAIEQLVEVSRLAFEYMDEELQDRPPSPVSAMPGPDYYSDAASITGTLGREYGWPPEVISKLPLKFVFQLLKEISDYHAAVNGKDAVMFNPSDRIKNEYLIQLNEGLKKN